MKTNPKEPLWVERYRPSTINECILPDVLKHQFSKIVEGGHMPNLILSGGAGTGKTTVAKAMCQELDLDWLVINCSEDTGIDVLRTRIKDFASTVSMTGNGKVIILDEADYMSHNLQAGLRNAIESFSKNCSFVMTCNYPNRIIDALFSRCVHVQFSFTQEDKTKLQTQFCKRVIDILNNENVKFKAQPVIMLINKFFPDNRRILNELQQYARAGEIDEGVLLQLKEVSIGNLFTAMKSKAFKDVRQWCAENSGNDISSLYSTIYKVLKDHVTSNSVPQCILILNDYQRYDSIVPDKELHLVAMCVQLMIDAEFK